MLTADKLKERFWHELLVPLQKLTTSSHMSTQIWHQHAIRKQHGNTRLLTVRIPLKILRLGVLTPRERRKTVNNDKKKKRFIVIPKPPQLTDRQVVPFKNKPKFIKNEEYWEFLTTPFWKVSVTSAAGGGRVAGRAGRAQPVAWHFRRESGRKTDFDSPVFAPNVTSRTMMREAVRRNYVVAWRAQSRAADTTTAPFFTHCITVLNTAPRCTALQTTYNTGLSSQFAGFGMGRDLVAT